MCAMTIRSRKRPPATGGFVELANERVVFERFTPGMGGGNDPTQREMPRSGFPVSGNVIFSLPGILRALSAFYFFGTAVCRTR